MTAAICQPTLVGIPESIRTQMHQGEWLAALEGLMHLRSQLGAKTPGPILSHAARCLHQLGRYTEAEAVTQEGLGESRRLIAPTASLLTEDTLVRQWGAMTSPVVSILCTTYNHERYIDGALRGFLSQQSPFRFEILVHDDASTDRTQDRIRAWQEKYPTILRAVLQTENQFSRGVRPFELLLQQAQGRYIATCEGDDYWLSPDKLAKQVRFLEEYPDFSCTAHNYYLYNESALSVRPWLGERGERVLSPRELMNITRLLWWPSLVFRKTFTALPPERSLAPIGDQFVTSYLGTFGQCLYFQSYLGAVRRENPYSMWTPLSASKKEAVRVKTWLALIRMHERLGNAQAVTDLRARVAASPLGADEKTQLIHSALLTPCPTRPSS